MRVVPRVHKKLRTGGAIALALGVSAILLLSSNHTSAAGLSVDKQVTTHQTSASTSITSPSFTTTQANELLVAFISSDGPKAANSQTVSAVTGGGLTWKLRQRTNAQPGTAEIWTAVAPSVVTNATVKATHSGSYLGSITVDSFIGADTANQGAVATGNSTSGAPSASLTTTRAGSWVWGVGDDWDNAKARTVGANQTKVDEYVASSTGDTYWVQRQTNPTASAGTVVSINDTAPTTDRWDLSTIEILPAGPTAPDTTPPSAPTNLAASASSATQVNLSWTASTDNVGVAGYNILRNGTQISTSTGTSFSDNTVAANTSYSYTVQAYDAAGNVSAASNTANVTTPFVDTTPPTVQLNSPANGSTVSGSTAVTATASDNVGVVGVQFMLDGSNLGAEATAAPYSLNWNSATASNGTHTLSARARDAAGNTSTSSVTVTVNNQSSGLAPTIDPSTPAATAVSNNVTTTTSPAFSPPANTVIYAVFSMDSASYEGPITSVSTVTTTGAPITWHLLGRNNASSTTAGGFLEVWWAYNPTAQTNITSTATFNLATKNVPAPVGDFQIMVMDNAAPDQSTAAWSNNSLLNSENNAPFANVTTTKANSQVFGVFDNWNNSQTPLPGSGQSISSIVLNTTDVDGYWVQKQNAPTAAAGTNVLMNATVQGQANQWRVLDWEVLAAN